MKFHEHTNTTHVHTHTQTPHTYTHALTDKRCPANNEFKENESWLVLLFFDMYIQILCMLLRFIGFHEEKEMCNGKLWSSGRIYFCLTVPVLA